MYSIPTSATPPEMHGFSYFWMIEMIEKVSNPLKWRQRYLLKKEEDACLEKKDKTV